MSIPLRVLILEDNPSDAELMLHELRRAGFVPEWQRVETEADYRAALDPALDLILADYRLPQFDGLRALQLLQEHALDIPFILVSGTIGEEVAVECMKQGAADYLLKDRLARLGQAVAHALEQKRLRDEKQRADHALRESEARLKEAQTLGKIGNWEFDHANQCIKWSDEVYRLYERDPAMGPPSAEEEAAYYSPEQAERLHEYARRAVEQGRAFEYDLEARLPSGRVAHFTATMRPVKDETGRIARIFGTVQDITARKQAEEALRASEERFRSILDNIEDGYYEVDTAGNFAFVNPALVRMLGRPANELIGINNRLYMPPEGAKAVFQTYNRVFRTGIPEQTFDWELVRPDGTRRSVEVSASLIKADGSIKGFRGTVRDVTARKRAEEMILRRNEELTTLNQIGQALSRLAEPPEILELVFTMIGRVLDNRNLYIALYDEASQSISFPVYTINGERVTRPSRALGNGLTEYVIRTHAPLFLPRDFLATLAERGIDSLGKPAQCFLAVPMGVVEKVIGVIAVQDYEKENVYDARHLELLTTIAAQAAIALENTRLFAETTERAERQAALYRISTSLAQRRGARELCQAVAAATREILHYPYLGVFLIEPETGDRVLQAQAGWDDAPEDWRLKPGEGISEQPIVTGEVHYAPDVTREPKYMPGLRDSHSELDVPIQAGEKVLGVLVVEDQRVDAFAAEDVAVLQAVANQLAVALESTRLFEETNVRAEQLALLYDAGLTLNRVLDPQVQLEFLLEIATKALHAERAEFFRQDAARNEMVFESGIGYSPETSDKLRAIRFRVSEERGLVGWVAQQRLPLNMPDVSADPRYVVIDPEIRSTLGVPIEHENQLRGVLAVSSTRVNAFSPDDERLFVLFANQISVAMETARLFEQTERRLRQIQALHTIDLAISSSFDLHLTLDILLNQVVSQLKLDAAAVLLLNPHTQMLEYAAGRGFHSAAIQQTRERLGDGHAGRAALERRFISIPNASHSEAGCARVQSLLASERFVAHHVMPLIAKGQVKGVLEVFHRAPFVPEDEWLGFFETLAEQAAIAIDNAALFEGLKRSNAELAMAYDSTLDGWSRALDLRDKEREGHSQRVTEMTLRLARALEMDEAELVHVRRGALLHDIGKLGIPDTILFKPGKLTDEEWGAMRGHPQFAYDLLAPIVYLRPALDIPYCHHEKWDGTGYPRGLKGEQIPLAARVFAVVDVYDALTSDRPYRKAWDEEKALEHVRERAGKHFDPKVVEAFLEIVR